MFFKENVLALAIGTLEHSFDGGKKKNDVCDSVNVDMTKCLENEIGSD